MPLTENTEVQDNLEVETRELKKVTVLSGQVLSRGDLVAYDATATTKVVGFLTTKDPLTVMAEDVDASAGDVIGLAFRDADIKASEVDFGTGTDAEVREALDFKNVYLMD